MWWPVLANADTQKHNFLPLHTRICASTAAWTHAVQPHERSPWKGGEGGEEGHREGGCSATQAVCKAVFLILASTVLEGRGDALQTDYYPLKSIEEPSHTGTIRQVPVVSIHLLSLTVWNMFTI